MIVLKEAGKGLTGRLNPLFILALACAFLFIVYLPVFLYPYLLLDETWIVRPGTYTSTLSMGRPLFSVFIWATGKVFAKYGLDVIYFMRISAIIGLTISIYFLVRWFERWGHNRLI